MGIMKPLLWSTAVATVSTAVEQLVGLYGFMLICIWYGFPIQWTKEAGEQSESGKRTTLYRSRLYTYNGDA